MRTLRSFWICAVAAVVLAAAGAALKGLVYYADPEPARAATTRDAVAGVLSWSSAVLQVVIVVLAVLVLSSEYTGGAIRVTFVAVPRRLSVMAAKALLVAVVTALLAALSLGLGYAAAVPFLNRVSPAGVPSGTMLGLLGVEIGYCVLVALFAFAVTLVVRGAAAATSVAAGVVLLLKVVLTVLDAMVESHLSGLAFSVAATRVMTDPLSSALPVVVAWLAVPAVLGSITLVRRDA